MSTAIQAQAEAALYNEQADDRPLTEEPIADAPAPVLTPEDHAMAAVDTAFGPVLARLRADMGPVHSSTLVAFAAAVRQALAHVVYGAPDPVETDGESLDMLGIQRRYGEGYRAYLEQCKADDITPVSLEQFARGETVDQTSNQPLTGDDPLPEVKQTAAQKKASADKLFA
jgi:hypothetical protein